MDLSNDRFWCHREYGVNCDRCADTHACFRHATSHVLHEQEAPGPLVELLKLDDRAGESLTCRLGGLGCWG